MTRPSVVLREAAPPTVAPPQGSFLQTPWWAAFKAGHGWKPLWFEYQFEGDPAHPLSVLWRRLPWGLGLAYVPHADLAPEAAGLLSSSLRRFLPRGTVCVRWDFWGGTEVAIGDDEASGAPDPVPGPLPRPFRKPPADVQPPDTVVVPLADDEAMLASMHKKTRYNIRLAEKKGVVVESAGVEALGEWYVLYRETAERDKISIHSERYYRDLFAHAPQLTLWLARYEGKLLAGNIVLVHGARATYLYGASSNEHRNLMAPYALQWAALTDARRRGCADYDLFGIPPTGDEGHPMHGLYRFKNGFGGRRLHRPGAWDVVYRPLVWGLWTRIDALRIWYFKVWKKR